ncbi:hypothetical protein C8Q80DRAFT_1274047 [Daedaleopsis nitida]|nr:hypothetical protein C8Q80DRAFT_1274047 [Daedaleopsis nitida]
MSEEMAPSWRSLASAASRSIKGYISQQRELKQGYPPSRPQLTPGPEQPKKQSWSQWAGQKIRRGSQGDYDISGDRLSLFPGWATRRYREPPLGTEAEAPFDVDVFVSGYAYKVTGISFNTRAGRAFLRLAKSFAALPKLPVGSVPGMSRSTEDLLSSTHLPPLPDEITDESEMQALDDKLRRLDFDAQSVDSGRNSDSFSLASSDSPGFDACTPSPASATSSYNGNITNGYIQSPRNISPLPPVVPGSSNDLHRWHANLEARLHPFWSSVLSNRTVRLSLYATDPTLYEADERHTDEASPSYTSPEKQPIVTREVTTAVDGSFQLKFSVPWERMCVHPGALQIAFGGDDFEHELFVGAEMLAPPVPGGVVPPDQYKPRFVQPVPSTVTTNTSISIPLTHSSIRVISDIDDTVKLSGILGGARAVFHNVFVKDLRDSVIRGMGDWYTSMWKRGVRFHYVSNGPFELLPVVNEFFQVSHLPPGSIRLRSYGGRSLFNGLLSAPAMRKRVAVLDILNHFPEARFLLVGDSGEQDLELYTEIARDRPDQILGIFIRDATARGDGGVRPLDDPTGAEAYRVAFDIDGGNGSPRSTSSRLSGTFGRRSGRSTPSRSGRSTPLRTHSLSDALPSTPPAPAQFGPPSAKRPSRSWSGTDALTMTPSQSSAESSGPASAPYDYFSSVPPTHSPITEEPHGSPEMIIQSSDAGTPTPVPGRSWPPPGFSKPPPGSQVEWRESGKWQPQAQASASLSDAEKKRVELQMRLWRARLEVSRQVAIRIFREPEECVEVNEILDSLQIQGR